ncbi:MAG: VWA domain-containing protein [Planctomycetota bacterium]|nr:MAG: VWA domain-containing protein [Planctomycetota bacterium]REK39815.1 MAG: VWA domain-containing protein [Planctomycetota bacterium]
MKDDSPIFVEVESPSPPIQGLADPLADDAPLVTRLRDRWANDVSPFDLPRPPHALPNFAAGAATAEGEDPVPRRDAGVASRLLRRAGNLAAPWAASTGVHALLMLAFSLILIPLLQPKDDQRAITVAMPDEELPDQDRNEALLALAPDPDSESSVREAVIIDPIVKEVDFSPPDPTAVPDDEESDLLSIEDLRTLDVSRKLPFTGIRRRFSKRNRGKAGPQVGDLTLRNALSADEAVDGVFGELRSQLVDGDLMVVWLFDSSISLVNDRQRVAKRLTKLFADLEESDAKDEAEAKDVHRLRNVAVAFGRGVKEIAKPTERTKKIIEAVQNIPLDNSGRENVFRAVQWCVRRYREKARDQLTVVVWTDEAGDDLDRLEQTVAVCREANVQVSVVGPSAVLGRSLGTHVWTHKPTKDEYWLPVAKGPDAALRERLKLPYWFEADLPEWTTYEPEVIGDLPPWFGGPQLERISSGFGPYAMTRLAAATGGSYTIFDRPADRGPFVLDDIRAYRPDYRSREEITRELEEHPLRAAVVRAVSLTYRGKVAEEPPRTTFFNVRRETRDRLINGDRTVRVYYAAATFRRRLRAELEDEQAKMKPTVAAIEKAIAVFQGGMESEYKTESSQRWRAWYDLTLGRLLAASVRYEEYRIFCLRVEEGAKQQAFRPETNHIECEAVEVLRGDTRTRKRADEAERLLTRCLEENPNTPWAYLAQRELDHPFGIDFRQVVIPEPRPAGGGSSGSGPRPGPPSLPNL